MAPSHGQHSAAGGDTAWPLAPVSQGPTRRASCFGAYAALYWIVFSEGGVSFALQTKTAAVSPHERIMAAGENAEAHPASAGPTHRSAGPQCPPPGVPWA